MQRGPEAAYAKARSDVSLPLCFCCKLSSGPCQQTNLPPAAAVWVNGRSSVLSRGESEPPRSLAYPLVVLGYGPLLTRKGWRPHIHLIWTFSGLLNVLDLLSNQQFAMGFISCYWVINFHGKFFFFKLPSHSFPWQILKKFFKRPTCSSPPAIWVSIWFYLSICSL